MAVYVDNARNSFRGRLMCHMLADTPAELHEMADKIGIDRRRYQGPAKASSPHYDICHSKRALAIQHGAIEVNRRELVAVIRRIRTMQHCWLI